MSVSFNKNPYSLRFCANVEIKKSANKLLDKTSYSTAKPLREFIESLNKDTHDVNVNISANWLKNRFNIEMQKDNRKHKYSIIPAKLMKDYNFSYKNTKKYLNAKYVTGLQKLGIKTNK